MIYLEVGKYYKTRNGLVAKISDFFRTSDEFPYYGAIKIGPFEWLPVKWTIYGYQSILNFDFDFDLIEGPFNSIEEVNEIITSRMDRPNWQLFETAPKDGKPFVGISFDREYRVWDVDTVSYKTKENLTKNLGLEYIKHYYDFYRDDFYNEQYQKVKCDYWIAFPQIPDSKNLSE